MSTSVPLAAPPRRAVIWWPIILLLLFALTFAGIVGIGTKQNAAAPVSALMRPGTYSVPSVAYTLVPGGVVKLNASTGNILAKWLLPSTVRDAGLAVSHDGTTIFVLNTAWDGQLATRQLTLLSGDTLTPQQAIAINYADATPTIAIMPDDRIVVILAVDGTMQPELAYFDRNVGGLTVVRTSLPGCGMARLTPLPSHQLAVLCADTNDVRLVDLDTHQVVGITPLGHPRARNLPGWASGITLVGTETIVVITDDAHLLRVDPKRRTVSPFGQIAGMTGAVIPIGGAYLGTNGRALVVVSGNDNERFSGKGSKLLVVDLLDGHVLDALSLSIQTTTGLGLSPDGSRAFITSADSAGRIQVVDLTTHQVKDFGEGSPQLRFP